MYNFTKRATDIRNQRLSSYTVNTKCKRWTVPTFFYILDTARVHTQTLQSLNDGKKPTVTNTFEFGSALAENILKPLIEKRNTKYLPTTQRNKVELIFNTSNGETSTAAPSK